MSSAEAQEEHVRVAGRPENLLPIVNVVGLQKSFGGVRALKGVDLKIYPGEVHGLLGANGAGKSTLIKVLAGLEIPDEGTTEVAGVPVKIGNPQQASALGLNFIHQELNLVPHFTAIQNMTLGLPKPTRLGLIDWRKLKSEVEGVKKRLGITFSLDTPVGELSVAEQWLLAIGRALIRRARLIAMDEPTASLSAVESERLFTVVRDLARDGIAILYVSHRLDEVLDLCDTFTVFKDGERVLYEQRLDMTKAALVRAIVGADLETSAGSEMAAQASVGRVVLELSGVSRSPKVRDVTLSVRSGEVLGLAGLVGAGRTELARLILGADTLEEGEIRLDGQPFRPRSPHEAVERGVVLVPEERRSEGLILDQSVAFNLNLPDLQPTRLFSGLPLVGVHKGNQRAQGIIDRLRIKTPSPSTPVRQLSGGNQQKVVIGKWLTRDPKVLILDEPSRGVDVGARSEIHRVIRSLATSGSSVIVISSDDEELPGLCDRVVVMVEGRVAGELRGEAIRKDTILQLSYGRANQEGDHGKQDDAA